jgi:hypothetical protein|nr:MAG TPA: zinc-ribbon family protein [Caudoviricetes sp.]
MIKIIRKGTRKIQECKECGCLFSYEKEDVTTKSNCLGIMPVYYEKYINCPQCKKNITLEEIKCPQCEKNITLEEIK